LVGALAKDFNGHAIPNRIASAARGQAHHGPESILEVAPDALRHSGKRRDNSFIILVFCYSGVPDRAT
jgi:hypothetical protein